MIRTLFLCFFVSLFPLLGNADVRKDSLPLLQPKVQWAEPSSALLSFTGPVRQEFIQQCLKGGLEVEYRFLLQACERRGGWFDSCSRTRKQIHQMSFDPVREAYRLVVDRLGDIEGPQLFHFSDLSQAVRRLGTIPEVPTTFFSQTTERSLKENTGYLSARYVTICKGEYSEALAQLSYFISFGLIDLGEEDTGWIDLPLDNSRSVSRRLSFPVP